MFSPSFLTRRVLLSPLAASFFLHLSQPSFVTRVPLSSLVAFLFPHSSRSSFPTHRVPLFSLAFLFSHWSRSSFLTRHFLPSSFPSYSPSLKITMNAPPVQCFPLRDPSTQQWYPCPSHCPIFYKMVHGTKVYVRRLSVVLFFISYFLFKTTNDLSDLCSECGHAASYHSGSSGQLINTYVSYFCMPSRTRLMPIVCANWPPLL